MGRNEFESRGRAWVLNWARNQGRVKDLAQLLNARPVSVYPEDWFSRRSVIGRYAMSFCVTICALMRARPKTIVAMSPPIPASALAVAWGRLTRTTVVLDCHPGSFGLQNDNWSARLSWLHRWAVRRAKAVLVTTPDLVAEVERLGGQGMVFHEATPAVRVDGALARQVATVLFPGTFAKDEPIDLVLEVARQLPGVDFRLTGDTKKCTAALLAAAPPNVTFLGYLGLEAYAAEVGSASALLALTTEDQSVQRSAWEAGYFGTPLVVSDTPATRTAFPDAVSVSHDPNVVAQALLEVLGSPAETKQRSDALAARIRRVLAEQTEMLKQVAEVAK